MNELPKLMLISQGKSILDHIQCIAFSKKATIPWIQIRFKEKYSTLDIKQLHEAISKYKSADLKITINDSIQIAQSTNADGVHLGLLDDHPSQARKELLNNSIIGSTANTFTDIEQRHEYVDYFGVGPFRTTTTKQNLSPILGKDGYTSIIKKCTEKNIAKPIFAIGGIEPKDVQTLLNIGIYGIAVSSSILQHENPQAQAHRFLQNLA